MITYPSYDFVKETKPIKQKLENMLVTIQKQN